jgi:hypothetical protein
MAGFRDEATGRKPVANTTEESAGNDRGVQLSLAGVAASVAKELTALGKFCQWLPYLRTWREAWQS